MAVARMSARVALPTKAASARRARAQPARPVSLSARRSLVCASAATDEIVEKLKTLTLLEASELVTSIEETFGVDASAPAGGMMMAAPGAAAGGEAAAEEKTEFDLVITAVDGSKKIAAIKAVRALTSLGLKEAKDAVTNLPFSVIEGGAKDACEDGKAKLEEQGCTVEIK